MQQLSDKAAQHLQAGRVKEAIISYKRLLGREPDLPDSWYNLGYLQRRARHFEAALESYQQALNRGVADPEEVHLNRSVIFAENLAQDDQAMAELHKALEINPDYCPALLNLGELQEDRGDRLEARKVYEHVLEIDPVNILALARLAGGAVVKGADDPFIERLRQAIARPESNETDKADIGFALGQTLDAVGAYDEAFAAYAAANEASRFNAETIGARYDTLKRAEAIDQLIAAFPEAEDSKDEKSAEAPVFICGMIRTGSTLAERILSSHSKVTAGGEMDILPSLIAEHLQPYPEVIERKRPYDIQKMRKIYLKGLRALYPNAQIITDKRPDNFLHIGLIKRLFPDAKIIHTVRNPLDKCLSIWFAHLDPSMSFALDLANIAHWCGQFDRLEKHWKKLWPDDIYDFDYDAMVANPEPHIRGLLDFCGLDWDEKCLSPHSASNTVRTASAWQIREPLYQKSSGRWKNYKPYLDELRAALDL